MSRKKEIEWTDEEIKIAIDLVNNGKSFSDVSLALNKTIYYVTKKIKTLGLKSGFNFNKGITKYENFNWIEIQKEYDLGLSQEEIMLKFDISESAIYWGVKNDKFKSRPYSETTKLAWKKGKYVNSSQEGVSRYRQLCEFKFNVYHFKNKFDIELIEKNGWYKAKNRGNNPNGVTRDHMYSIKKGFENNIDPFYISHPANCKLMLHTENNKKKTECSITIEELYERVKNW